MSRLALLSALAAGCSAGEGSVAPAPADEAQSNLEQSDAGAVLLHEIALGATGRVRFWQTEAGIVVAANGSLADGEATVRRQLEALNAERPEFVYKAFSHDAVLPPSLQHLPKLAFERGDRATESKSAETGGARFGGGTTASNAPSEGVAALTQPLTQADNTWLDQVVCNGAERCDRGWGWIYSGYQSNQVQRQFFAVNHSDYGVADFATRWWRTGGAPRILFRYTLSPNTWRSQTVYGVVGPMIIDGYVSGHIVENVTGLPTPTFTDQTYHPTAEVSLAQRGGYFNTTSWGNYVYGSMEGARCANYVETSFRNLPNRPTASFNYVSRGGQYVPPYNNYLSEFGSWDYHIQGMQRLAGVDDDRWLAVTRAGAAAGCPGCSGSSAGFMLVHLAHTTGGPGGTPFASKISGAPVTGTQYYYPIAGTKHPGGIQAFGKYLAVMNEPSGQSVPFVTIHDISNPANAQLIQRVDFPGDQGEPIKPDTSSSGVAVTKLADGRYLMFVLGKDDTSRGWFYVTDNYGLLSASTFWRFVDMDSNVGSWQNANFVSECTTGKTFLILTNNGGFTGPLSAGANTARLVEVTTVGSDISLRTVVTRNFATADYIDNCNFRAAGNAYVDTYGRLLLYCHTHHSATGIPGLSTVDPMLKFSEQGP